MRNQTMSDWRLRGVFLFLFAAGVTFGAQAQYPGYHSLAGPPAFRRDFIRESAKIQSITSNFTQEKTLSALTEKIVSSGKFWFRRSDKVRIEYLEPFTYLMILNGDKVLVHDDLKTTRINAKSSKLFQQVNRIILDCVTGTILESKDFTSKIFENDQTFLLEMTPSTKILRDFFSTIVAIIDKKDYSVRSIEMNEPLGDKTVIYFTGKKLNNPIPDEVFAL